MLRSFMTPRFASALSLATLAAACNAGTSTSGAGGAGAATTVAETTSTVTTATGTTTGAFMSTVSVGGGMPCVPGGPDDDVDGDGFSPNQGDCDDCDPNQSPNAIEVPTEEGGTPYDEDCDGQTDEDDSVLCDTDLAIDDADPLSAAKAIELCKMSTGDKDWGVVDAKWVLADGSALPTDPTLLANFHLGHGLLPKFGANVQVRKGQRMLALSSGTARQPTDPGWHYASSFDKGFTSGQPVGFPKESPSCPGSVTGLPNDPAAVEINVRTPSNAQGISFDFDFFTFEWPQFICSQYNDFFIALLTPFPPGQTDGNISFDSMMNPISVNNALLEVCGCPGNPPGQCEAPPGGLTPKYFDCSLGNTDLIGTGFGFDTPAPGGGSPQGQDHGSTGWLRTSAPVPPSSTINLRFAVYDSSDHQLDSTTMVDNLQWIAKPGTMVGTVPVPQ